MSSMSDRRRPLGWVPAPVRESERIARAREGETIVASRFLAFAPTRQLMQKYNTHTYATPVYMHVDTSHTPQCVDTYR